MSISSYHVLGLMSGTSCDGLDMVLVRIDRNGERWQYGLIDAQTLPYDQEQQSFLRNIKQLNAQELLSAHYEWGNYFGQCAQKFLTNHASIKVDFIASHGHTVYHQPQKGWTFQMGAGSALAVAAQLPVVSDFRTTDVANGGQGAPLVPIGDRLFFSNYDFCLNLGGFANISYELNNERFAFDICPLNLPMNLLSNRLGGTFDKDGEWARQGVVNEDLLQALNTLEYYQIPPPKSLGSEWYEEHYIACLKRYSIPVIDMLSTVVEHAAFQVAQCTVGWSGRVLVTGGGAWNQFLLSRMRAHAPNMEWVVPNEDLVNFKEALIFALLGALRWEQEPNALASVTGANKDSIGGAIYYY
jgi:anhydro-N-acetylmuramic acid kinase